jgi:oligopeptide/dipeptide ABC transporter ATP-binding protein
MAMPTVPPTAPSAPHPERTPDSQAGAHPLVSVRDLHVRFPIAQGVFRWRVGWVRAVDGVSFTVARGETLALVGESGCGKTTTGRALLRLIATSAGQIAFDGVDVLTLRPEPLRRLRRRMQLVFQDPYSSLNPRRTVGDAIREGLIVHQLAEGEAADARVRHVLEEVGLRSDFARRYPYELSGGQRQRVGIARALVVEPEFIVCDEPVSALDVSVQAQIINLLQDLQRDHDLTYLYIAHDLAIVAQVASRIAVMYFGRIVELGPADAVFHDPLMPYTRALLASVLVPDPTTRRARVVLAGESPSPTAPPPGCVFHPRCPDPRKDAACTRAVPPLEEKAPGRFAACIKEPVRL